MTEGSRQEAATDRLGRDRKGRSRDAIAPLRPLSKSRGSTLRESEKYYRTLFNTMAEGFALHELLYDAEGRPCDYRFLEVNPAFERQTGLKAADLVGRTVREVLPDVEPMWIERYGRVALTGEPEQFEAPSESLGRYFEVRAYQAGPGRFAAVFTDITARRQAEQAARELALFPQQNPFPVLRIAANGTLLYANRGATGLLKTWRCRVGRTVPSRVREAIKQTLTAEHPGEIEVQCGAILHCFTVIPIREEGYANLYGRDITERKATEEALRESESRLRLAQASAGAGLWDWDLSANRLEWSDELFHLFGLDPEKAEANLDSWTNVLHPEDRHVARQQIKEAINQHTPLDSEYRIVLPSGQVRWINALGNTMYDRTDQPRRMTGICIDITERKRAGETVRDSERRFRQVAESLPQLVWTCQADGPCDYLSPQWVDYTGKPEAIQLGYGWLEQLHPDDRDRVIATWKATAARGDDFRIEFRIRRHDGAYRWFRTLAVPLRDEGGRIVRWFGSNTDIQDIKEAEAALRQSREDLARAQAVGRIGSWRLDVRRNVLTWSAENHRIFGVPKGTPMTYETFLAIVHPDDRSYVDTQWNAGLRGERYDIEHRIVVDGQVKWVREKAYLEFDEEGKLLGGFGITQEITDRRAAQQALKEANEQLQMQAEELAAANEELRTQTEELQRQTTELRESEQRLRTALEGGQMGLWEWDVENDVAVWDERVCQLLGVEKQEPIPSDAFFRRVHRDDQEALRARFEEALATGADFQAEFRAVRPNGEIVWLASHSVVLRDEERCGARMLGIMFDITKRKQLEEALRRLNDELEEEVQAQTEELKNTIDQLEKEVARRRLAEKNLRERSRLLEGFFRHTITPLAFMDRQFNFVQVNDAYANADEREPKDFIGQNHFAMYPNAENQAVFEEVVRTKQPYHALAKPFQFAERPERGVSYWNWQLTPLLDDAGEVQFLVLNLQDVTARQETMRELEKRTSQLQRLTAELSEAEDRERRRLAELLHDDLQQLLVGSKLRLNILARKLKGTPEIRELVDETTSLIAESIQKSRGLSHELSPPVLHHGDLREVLQWLIEQIHTTCGLKVRLWIGAGVDLRSQTLKTFVYKAVRELLFNVVKHANVRRAAIVVQRQEQSIRLAVLDKGRGFEAEHLDVAGQNGFGLFNIRERVQFLGGLLTVQSVPGRGSRFVLTIPLSVPDETAGQKTGAPILSIPFRLATQPARDTSAVRQRFRILLVDDHKVMRDGLAALLEEEPDIEVVGQAGNGRDAITLTGQLKPDVVVMDVVMPIIDGEEATRQIRTQWPRVRVVALSMLEEDATRERMLKAGAEVFLSKAGPSEVIAAAIRRSS